MAREGLYIDQHGTDRVGYLMADPGYMLRFDQINMLLKDNSGISVYTNQTVNTDLQNALLRLLNRVFSAAYEWPIWSASTVKNKGDSIQDGEFRYIALTAGTTGASSPSFPTTISGTVADDGVTWECVQRLPLLQYDEIFDEAKKSIGNVGNNHEDVTLAKNWIETCQINTNDIIAIKEKRDDGAGNYKNIVVLTIATSAGTLGTKPSYLDASSITKGDAVTNSGGTAVLIVKDVACSSSGTETCPLLNGFHDCINRLKDKQYLITFIENILIAATE